MFRCTGKSTSSILKRLQVGSWALLWLFAQPPSEDDVLNNDWLFIESPVYWPEYTEHRDTSAAGSAREMIHITLASSETVAWSRCACSEQFGSMSKPCLRPLCASSASGVANMLRPAEVVDVAAASVRTYSPASSASPAGWKPIRFVVQASDIEWPLERDLLPAPPAPPARGGLDLGSLFDDDQVT